MRLPVYLAVCLLSGVAACGGAQSPDAKPASENPPLTAEQLRTRWGALARDEVRINEEMARLALASDKVQGLQPIRSDAGMLLASLNRLDSVPPELAACRARGAAGAKTLKDTLDTINDLWMGRVARAANASQQADEISERLCKGFSELRAARAACGVVVDKTEAHSTLACPE
ncbi:MAG: hypothetical protein JWM74_1165 [Myxococcaceae bacterium]|nr:hypothetical protein [Myxococcaceae bacterium]